MTGYAESAARASGFLRPGMELVSKPIALGTLAARLRRILIPFHGIDGVMDRTASSHHGKPVRRRRTAGSSQYGRKASVRA